MPTTFTTLVEDIADELNRSDADTIASIPRFINYAELVLCNAVENVGYEEIVNGFFLAGNYAYPKPGRWRTHLSFSVGSGAGFNTKNLLELRTREFIEMYTPNPTDATQFGLPLFYADYGYNNYYIGPTPDQAYPFEISYIQLPVPLSVINQTNWFTDFAPDLIFYGALLQSAPFLRDQERIAEWKDFYKSSLDAINNRDGSRKIDRGTLRTAD